MAFRYIYPFAFACLSTISFMFAGCGGGGSKRRRRWRGDSATVGAKRLDGHNASFGDSSLQSTSSDVQDVVVYASSDSTAPGRLVFVAIHRSRSSKVTALTSQPLSRTAYLYQMIAASAESQNMVEPAAAGQIAVSGASLTLTLPALSVTTIDVH